MTDIQARTLFDREVPIDTYHIIYPEDIYATADEIIGWAHDAMVNQAIDEYVRLHGPFADGPDGQQAYDILAAGVQRPDVQGAMEFLSDIGTHTFARIDLRHGVAVNRMQDVAALRSRARRCFPKEQHATKGAAEAQIRSLLKRDLHKNERLHAYECTFCGSWHVGHGDGRS